MQKSILWSKIGTPTLPSEENIFSSSTTRMFTPSKLFASIFPIYAYSIFITFISVYFPPFSLFLSIFHSFLLSISYLTVPLPQKRPTEIFPGQGGGWGGSNRKPVNIRGGPGLGPAD